MKAAVVLIIGRPSTGKSTLLNRFCEEHVAIVAAVPQTTRNRIRGIVTEERGQIVFIDTPGLHSSDRKLNLRLKAMVAESLDEVDIVLYLLDSTRPPGDEERAIAALVRPHKKQVVAALTKIDILPPRSHRDAALSFLAAELPGTPVVSVSGVTGDGVKELLTLLFERAPEGEAMYPEEYYTDQPPEFRVSEIIRGEAISRVREEVPHALYVEIADMELPDADASRNLGLPETRDHGSAAEGEHPAGRVQTMWIRAFIVVERESQKGILVGRGGRVIKEIRVASQREIARLFPYRISLDLRVKVDPKWRSNDRLLKRILY